MFHTALLYGIWLCQIFYFLCLIPQIWTNHQRKSGEGLSDFFLFCYFNAYWTLLYYVFGMNLPLGYKVICPMQATGTLVLIFQRFYFDKEKMAFWWRYVYAATTVVALSILPFMAVDPIRTSMTLGWINFFIFAVSQLPQIFKIFITRSVEGFSFGFVALLGIAGVIELISSIGLGLPMQTVLSAVRNCAVAACYMLQFHLFGKGFKNKP